jgi:hypothetical protein
MIRRSVSRKSGLYSALSDFAGLFTLFWLCQVNGSGCIGKSDKGPRLGLPDEAIFGQNPPR